MNLSYPQGLEIKSHHTILYEPMMPNSVLTQIGYQIPNKEDNNTLDLALSG
ncbi:hypothetical protein [Xenorhabdus entomophaga]|uniref:hypothetical protein n=1 Tax=Xenorhabdus entomophaga TaxID=3136257 RepID=UPI0030F48411